MTTYQPRSPEEANATLAETGVLDQVVVETQAQRYAAIREAGNLPAERYPDGRLRAIMKMSVPSDATASEAAAFLSICEKYDLDPIMGQIFLAKTDKGEVKVVAGRDTYITVAERRPTFWGIVPGTVLEDEEVEIRRDPDDAWTVTIDHVHTFTGSGEVVGWYCVVFDKERPPIIFTRRASDYQYLMSRKAWIKDKKGMGENRCIAGALKRMYSLSGLWIEGEELDVVAGEADAVIPEARTVSTTEQLTKAVEAKHAAIEVVEDSWDPEMVIQEGKWQGKRFCDVAEVERKYLRMVVNRRWLGYSDAQYAKMLDYVETLDALDGIGPKAQEAQSGIKEEEGLIPDPSGFTPGGPVKLSEAGPGPSEPEVAQEGPPEPQEAPGPVLARERGIDEIYQDVQKAMQALAADGQLDWELAMKADILLEEGDIEGMVALLAKVEQMRGPAER